MQVEARAPLVLPPLPVEKPAVTATLKELGLLTPKKAFETFLNDIGYKLLQKPQLPGPEEPGTNEELESLAEFCGNERYEGKEVCSVSETGEFDLSPLGMLIAPEEICKDVVQFIPVKDCADQIVNRAVETEGNFLVFSSQDGTYRTLINPRLLEKYVKRNIAYYDVPLLDEGNYDQSIKKTNKFEGIVGFGLLIAVTTGMFVLFNSAGPDIVQVVSSEGGSGEEKKK